MILEFTFWLIAFLIVYTYLIYPLLLIVISGLVQSLGDTRYILHKTDRRTVAPDEWPNVAIVFSAYNEERHIVDRINNLLEQDYPLDKLSIYIGSDGSNDRTVEFVRTIKDKRVKLFEYSENRGKITVLNELLSNITETVVVFTDANTVYHSDTIKKLARHFISGNIAGVCGELYLVNPKKGSNKDSVYWRLERILKYHEGKINGFLGANGAIYAISRKYFTPLPADTIIDDFSIFMKIGLDGHKVIYDTEAIAEEEVAPDMFAEYGRRVRIGAGNYQAFFRFLYGLNPKHKWRVFTYVSHKVIRWFTPHLMVLLFLVNLTLLDQLLYQFTLLIQVSVYVMTFLVVKYFHSHQFPSFITLPVFLVYMNAALAHGFIRYLSGNSKGTWERTER